MATQIPLDRVTDNPWQTRSSYDEEHIEALAGDINKNGLLQLGHLTTTFGDDVLKVTRQGERELAAAGDGAAEATPELATAGGHDLTSGGSPRDPDTLDAFTGQRG